MQQIPVSIHLLLIPLLLMGVTFIQPSSGLSCVICKSENEIQGQYEGTFQDADLGYGSGNRELDEYIESESLPDCAGWGHWGQRNGSPFISTNCPGGCFIQIMRGIKLQSEESRMLELGGRTVRGCLMTPTQFGIKSGCQDSSDLMRNHFYWYFAKRGWENIQLKFFTAHGCQCDNKDFCNDQRDPSLKIVDDKVKEWREKDCIYCRSVTRQDVDFHKPKLPDSSYSRQFDNSTPSCELFRDAQVLDIKYLKKCENGCSQILAKVASQTSATSVMSWKWEEKGCSKQSEKDACVDVSNDVKSKIEVNMPDSKIVFHTAQDCRCDSVHCNKIDNDKGKKAVDEAYKKWKSGNGKGIRVKGGMPVAMCVLMVASMSLWWQ